MLYNKVLSTNLPCALFYKGNGINANTSTSNSYTNLDFGDATSDRIIILSLYSQGSATLTSSVTIGGVSATRINSIVNGNGMTASMWSAAVPTGTTGTIVINGLSGLRHSYGWWSLYNANSATPTATQSQTFANGATSNLTVSANAGGCIIAGGGFQSSSLEICGQGADGMFQGGVGSLTVSYLNAAAGSTVITGTGITQRYNVLVTTAGTSQGCVFMVSAFR